MSLICNQVAHEAAEAKRVYGIAKLVELMTRRQDNLFYRFPHDLSRTIVEHSIKPGYNKTNVMSMVESQFRNEQRRCS